VDDVEVEEGVGLKEVRALFDWKMGASASRPQEIREEVLTVQSSI